MNFLRSLLPALSLFGLLLTVGQVSAQTQEAATPQPIGEVVSMTPAVFGPNSRLKIGSPIYENDKISTGPSGVVELRFIDNTRLVLGSRSSVVLDKFVYDKDGKAKAVVLKMLSGAFRFSTGASPKRAYKVNTPGAAIGVRGTKFDVGLQPETSRVTIFEGAMRICPPRRPVRFCKTVSIPGQTALVQNGVVTIVGDGVQFTEHCIGSDASSLCHTFGRRP